MELIKPGQPWAETLGAMGGRVGTWGRGNGRRPNFLTGTSSAARFLRNLTTSTSFFSSHESFVFAFYMAFFGKMHPGHEPQRSLLPRSVPLRHVNHQPRQPSLAVQCPVARRGEADFANDQRRVPRRSAILHTTVRYVPNEVLFPVPGRCRLQCKRWGPRGS